MKLDHRENRFHRLYPMLIGEGRVGQALCQPDGQFPLHGEIGVARTDEPCARAKTARIEHPAEDRLTNPELFLNRPARAADLVADHSLSALPAKIRHGL